MIAQTPALWTFEEDILNRSWLDWLAAHMSLGKPLHKYEGMLTLYTNTLELIGQEKRTKEDFSLEIYRQEIEQLYLGFDEAFNASETRTLGLTWLPLRLMFIKNEQERKLYLIINHSFGRTDNKEYFEFLKQWVS
ncbi:MAG: hypothetical protein M3Z26_17535 [Bacteroidota bacterium]|nr:hypothetical protein [Bacteroidota bacterium]MDQ2721543.1 hypothetical protein [Bacteroidota bacterium]